MASFTLGFVKMAPCTDTWVTSYVTRGLLSTSGSDALGAGIFLLMLEQDLCRGKRSERDSPQQATESPRKNDVEV